MGGATADNRITAALAELLELTLLCRQAITAEDPPCLLEKLQERQRAMNQIDTLRNSQTAWTDQQLQLLTAIRELDAAIRTEAQNLTDLYRRNLLGIRKQRRIQSYTLASGQYRHYLDTCE